MTIKVSQEAGTVFLSVEELNLKATFMNAEDCAKFIQALLDKVTRY